MIQLDVLAIIAPGITCSSLNCPSADSPFCAGVTLSWVCSYGMADFFKISAGGYWMFFVEIVQHAAL